MVGAGSLLVLTVTRRCNLRCAYCPTVKDGWPDLSPADAGRAVRLFAERFGGGEIKLFGGEPTLVPEVVDAALDAAEAEPSISRVQLSTNGVGLLEPWLGTLLRRRKLVIALSIDGTAADHNRLRRGLGATIDSHSPVSDLARRLRGAVPLVATQVIAPATAHNAAANFDAVRNLGVRVINLLPGYYVPWRSEQLTALRAGLWAIGDRIEECWDRGEGLYLRNLAVRAPLPFFNSGLVVDCDGSIHPANVALAGSLADLHGRLRVGSLDDPPTPSELAAKARDLPAVLEAHLPPTVWHSTLAVDAELSTLVRRLLPRWLTRRGARGAAA